MEPGRSEFSLLRAFQCWPRNCRSPYGLFAIWFFVCGWLIANQAVFKCNSDFICTKIISIGKGEFFF